jgi:hypothetical protein
MSGTQRQTLRSPSDVGTPSPIHKELIPSFCSIIKEIITPVMPPTPFIVICQSWSCWLSTILALCLLIHGAFFPKQFHNLFKLTGWASSDASWGTLEEINLPSSSSCFILRSGSFTFFQPFLETLRCNHHGFIFSLDVWFPHITR